MDIWKFQELRNLGIWELYTEGSKQEVGWIKDEGRIHQYPISLKVDSLSLNPPYKGKIPLNE